ncbi:hypothetical protein [Streptomyces sp. NPDC047886]|uniref:hypothetical protein n=1 Tax=Streptomyces sp. NPDC047886 TaxID=3365490 RepID=UPI0037226C09
MPWPDHPAAQDRDFTARYGGALLVAVAVQLVETVLAVEAFVLHAVGQDDPMADPHGYAVILPVLGLPVLLLVGAVAGAAVSALVVLPLVAAAERLGRRGADGPTAWLAVLTAAVAAAAAAVWAAWAGAAPVPAAVVWLAVTVALAAPGLAARPALARRGDPRLGRLCGRVALYGALTATAVAVAGVVAVRLA